MRALLFTTGSPFARAVRIILDELGLEHERREEITTPTAERRAQATPTLQVPTLWDGDITLWESGVIAEYLLATYPQRQKVKIGARVPLATRTIMRGLTGCPLGRHAAPLGERTCLNQSPQPSGTLQRARLVRA